MHNHLTPEVVHLMRFLESQHSGRVGRARERRTRRLTFLAWREVDRKSHEPSARFFGPPSPRKRGPAASTKPLYDHDGRRGCLPRAEPPGSVLDCWSITRRLSPAACAFSAAWLVTETIASAVLGWVAAAFLIYCVRARADYWPAYVLRAGRLCRGFYWIYGTVAQFRGLWALCLGPDLLALRRERGVFFLVFAWTHHNLGPIFDASLSARRPRSS